MATLLARNRWREYIKDMLRRLALMLIAVGLILGPLSGIGAMAHDLGDDAGMIHAASGHDGHCDAPQPAKPLAAKAGPCVGCPCAFALPGLGAAWETAAPRPLGTTLAVAESAPVGRNAAPGLRPPRS